MSNPFSNATPSAMANVPSTRGCRFSPADSVLLALLLVHIPVFSSAQAENEKHAHEHPHEEHDPVETIVVTASPLEHDRDELAVPVDRVDRDELIENLGATLGDSINHIPGVASTGFSSGASRPVIRGQDAYRTEVLEDGLGTQDVSRESPDHAVPVNPLAAERIEIVRGPAVLRYGGGASAGVVNVVTNRIPDRLREDGFGGEVYGGIGLVANERDLAASIDAARGPFALHVDGLFRRSRNYSIPNDGNPHTQSGTQTEAWMGSVGAAYIGGLGRIGAAYTRAENVYGLPEASGSVEVDMRTDRFRIEGDLFEPVAGIREIRLRSVYSNYEHDEIADGLVDQTFENEEFEGRLEAVHETFLDWAGAFGPHVKIRDFRGEGEAADFLAPTETTTAAVYFFEERPLGDSVTTELGFRLEHSRVEGRDIADVSRDIGFLAISGALGFVAKPTEWLTLSLNSSISQREPSQVELLARGPHEATGTFERGDPDLDLETGYTGENRVEAEAAHGRLEWAGFVTRYENYISAARTGIDVNESGGAPGPGDDLFGELVYADRDALFYGFEIAGDLDLFELEVGTIGVDGRFDYVRARFDSPGIGGSRDLPRIVPIRWGGGVHFEGEVLVARVGFVRNLRAASGVAQSERGASDRSEMHGSVSGIHRGVIRRFRVRSTLNFP